MANMFRTNSLNNTNESPRSPFKRYSVCTGSGASICTSPGVLQDLTLENSYSSFDAARAPGGGGIHSPMQGRSVRELEEQMSALRKENFNLKLRIYFLEENHHGARGVNNASDSPTKQLIDAKIEIEVLRKKIEEKTELLKDAARAISQHEHMQKKADMESQTMIEQMQQYINQLEDAAKHRETIKSMETLSAEKLKNLEAEVLKLENALRESNLRESEAMRQREDLTTDLEERLESLAACEAKISELAIKNAELVEKMEKQQETEQLANTSSNDHQTIQQLQQAETKLADWERVYGQACRTIQKLMQKVSSQEKEIKRFQEQQQPNDIATSTTSPKHLHSLSDNEALAADISLSLKQRYEQQLAEQDKQIKQLQADVQTQTGNLQNVVNNELWQANREVERLTKLVSTQKTQVAEVSGNDTLTVVGAPFTEAEFAKAGKRNLLLQRKVDVLIHRLDEEQQKSQQNSKLNAQLQHELHTLQADVESAHKWRLECADVCSVLTVRLEELAGFLNSLLKNKDVLGVLAADRRHAMRCAVDRSLDLSKSLNMTLSVTGVSLADQSLAQLSRLSEILYTGAEERNHTYNSHEDMQAVGKMMMESKKEEKPKSKERRSLPLPHADNQSESEAWSEPDRKVSLARIGLEDTSNSIVGAMGMEQRLSESDSEGHVRKQSERNTATRNTERINQLEALIAKRDERLLAAQCQLVDADNRLKQEQLRVLEITQQLEQLHTQNLALQSDLRAIGTQDEQEIAELQAVIELKTQELEKLQVVHNTLVADSQIMEMELQEAQRKMCDMEGQHAMTLQGVQAELAQFRLDAAQRLGEQERLQQEALKRDYVAVTQYEELKAQLHETQLSIEFYQESEKELKQTLVENELTARSLKKELDHSTLQASKAITERTKAYNDKLQLEQKLDELKQQLTQLQQEQQQQRQHQLKRINSSDVSQSGYTSEEVVPVRATSSANAAGRVNNPSPDLGIESDVGRVLSVELSSAQRTLLKTVELAAADEAAADEDISPDTEACAPAEAVRTHPLHDCAKVEKENADLRIKLTHTKQAFENTYRKLLEVNKAKAQVAKDIKNQILKTHNVLRNVRSNMENVL